MKLTKAEEALIREHRVKADQKKKVWEQWRPIMKALMAGKVVDVGGDKLRLGKYGLEHKTCLTGGYWMTAQSFWTIDEPEIFNREDVLDYNTPDEDM